MRKMNGNRGKRDRNARYKPWVPLVAFQVPVEAERMGVVAAYQNIHLTIFIKEETSDAFLDPDGNPSKIVHLIIKWSDLKRHDEIPYRFKQKAKRELLGPHSEAVELFPADWREEELSQTHLWALPPGAAFPIGLVPDDTDKRVADSVGGSENILTKEELSVYVVRHEDVVEVFASEAEGIGMYKGKELPDGATGGVEMLMDVPDESSCVAWSQGAKDKRVKVISKSYTVERAPEHPVPELFYDTETIEDGIWAGITDADDDAAQVGLEESLALADAMKEAMGSRADDRARRVREVTDEVVGKAERNIANIRKSAGKLIVAK